MERLVPALALGISPGVLASYLDQAHRVSEYRALLLSVCFTPVGTLDIHPPLVSELPNNACKVPQQPPNISLALTALREEEGGHHCLCFLKRKQVQGGLCSTD